MRSALVATRRCVEAHARGHGCRDGEHDATRRGEKLAFTEGSWTEQGVCPKHAPCTGPVMPRRKSSVAETPPLVAWEELPPQRQVLDWRKRAADFGINPATDDGGDDPDAVARLVSLDEEPEAASVQTLDGDDEDGFRTDELVQEAPEESVRREDAD